MNSLIVRALSICLVCLLLAVPAFAEVPAGGEDVVEVAAVRYRGAAADGQVDFAPVQSPKTPIRFATLRKTDYPWDLAIQGPSTREIQRDDVLLFTVRIRAISTASETGDAQVEVVFEQASAPHDKSMIARAGVRPEDGWKTLYFPFHAQQRFAAGEGQISLRPGFGPQVLEIADIRVINYHNAVAMGDLPITHATYAGREPDARWRADALKRIEQIRKGDLSIRVVDGQGKAMPEAKVHVQMRRHAYAFGSAVSAPLLLQSGADADRYREQIKRMFNRVVIENDLKWPAWSKDSKPGLDALKWLKENNIPVRGHCIVWPSWRYTPGFLKQQANDLPRLRETIARRVSEVATATRGLVVEWDVVNEPFSQRDILDVLGDDVMAEWFRLAKLADPTARLFVNDFPSLAGGKHLDHYEKTIARLQSLGAPLEGIGLQCHYGADLVPPEQIMAALDRFSKFGLPIQATEFDVENYDEQLQADYLRDHMIAFFSHPSTSGIMMWGFWEGRHWKPTAALYRKDWSVRPNGVVWNELVFKQWWTDEIATTDARGAYKVRGFLGDYEITAALGDRNVTQLVRLTHDGADVTITLP